MKLKRFWCSIVSKPIAYRVCVARIKRPVPRIVRNILLFIRPRQIICIATSFCHSTHKACTHAKINDFKFPFFYCVNLNFLIIRNVWIIILTRMQIYYVQSYRMNTNIHFSSKPQTYIDEVYNLYVHTIYINNCFTFCD